MEDSNIMQQHTAGGQSLGFDYQFYYFVYLLLELRHGEKIGYEVKDDIHIAKPDGSVILMQAKHTIQTNSSGNPVNITTLDNDMWKTINIWATIIKEISNDILRNYSFVLVTNKSDSGKNEVIEIIRSFQNGEKTIDDVTTKFKELITQTKDKTIQSYIKNGKSIPKKKLQLFLNKLSFAVGEDNIISKIKERLIEKLSCRDYVIIDQVFDNLISNILANKYIEIKNGNAYELSFDNFTSKFTNCFKVALETRPLPPRKYTYTLTDDIEQQLFIRQLIDIGEVQKGSADIFNYASHWYQAFNQIQFWTEENFVLQTELDELENNVILIWSNEFRTKYRAINTEIQKGKTIEELEDKIKELAIELVDSIRGKELSLLNRYLGVENSNGYFYALSDEPKIGWHLNWEKKYK